MCYKVFNFDVYHLYVIEVGNCNCGVLNDEINPISEFTSKNQFPWQVITYIFM